MGSKLPSVRPPKLGPGARIALIAPAGPLLELDDLVRGRELCQALGWEPRPAPHAGRHYGYLAGTDAERLEDLNAALCDPAIDAVWCLRGGYGVTRLLDQVDFDAVARRPRPLIGYSDITALLNAVTRATGVVTFHGPVARHSLSSFSRRHLERVLTQANPPGRLGRVAPPAEVLVPDRDRIVTLRSGVAEGPLVGGNLSLMQCLVGTRHFPDTRGAILFLEDVGEDLYRLDRMLSHLRMAGHLQGLAGAALGRFTEMHRASDDGALGLGEVLGTYFGPLNIPVAYGFPIGHVDDQWTLPVGGRARLDAENGEMDLVEAAVA